MYAENSARNETSLFLQSQVYIYHNIGKTLLGEGRSNLGHQQLFSKEKKRQGNVAYR